MCTIFLVFAGSFDVKTVVMTTARMVETEESYSPNGGSNPVPRPHIFVKTIKMIQTI